MKKITKRMIEKIKNVKIMKVKINKELTMGI